MYGQACRIIKPHKKSFSGEITENDRNMLSEMAKRPFCDLFLSAFLNESDINKFSGRIKTWNLYDLGYRLKDGKTVEILHPSSGAYANPGELASGGLVINRGEVQYMGSQASGGIFVNYGIAYSMGDAAQGGTFINLAATKDLARGASGGVFVEWTRPEDRSYPNGGEIYVERKTIESDKILSGLFDELELAGREKGTEKIGKIARQVDSHIRANYKRRVA